MQSTKDYYEHFGTDEPIDVSRIRTDNEEAFVRSLAEIGEVEILLDD